MAGSYHHIFSDEDNEYRGVKLLDDLGDAAEAIDQMFFMIQVLAGGNTKKINDANDHYYRCVRGEEPWPQFIVDKQGWDNE